ncbi:ATP-binding protein [Streptomyces scabiei]|uniref:ATP-binding protein n=1 Tax=Streptomyces scabiei TaxID=1930 RepID=UPI0029B42BFE|nr:ATP-binding protein [Streptomyces scabiei]MDX3519769.1 ATP-binding protein [Streptomyces scabiei]
MNNETSPSQGSSPRPVREFAMRFTSSTRGARLARRLVSHRLDSWGHPYTSHANEALTLITSELAANAVRHGHVAGRDFHVRLTEIDGCPHTLRVEVTDTRAERVPLLACPESPEDEESGRGLIIVDQLATRWAVDPRAGAPGKTVWAEVRPWRETGPAARPLPPTRTHVGS